MDWLWSWLNAPYHATNADWVWLNIVTVVLFWHVYNRKRHR